MQGTQYAPRESILCMEHFVALQLWVSASLAISTSVLKALPGKLDIKRFLPRVLYICLVKTIALVKKKERK